MTQSIRAAGERGSSVAPHSMSELYPRGGEVDDALYILHADDGSAETAALVRAEDSVTVVTPTRVMPDVVEDDLKLQELSVLRTKYATDAITLLKRSYYTGMSRLQGAVCKIDDNITDYLT